MKPQGYPLFQLLDGLFALFLYIKGKIWYYGKILSAAAALFTAPARFLYGMQADKIG